MIVRVLQLSESARKAEVQAEFDKPIDDSMRVGLLKSGLQASAHRASNCMGWIWRQWLLGASRKAISRKVEPFVSRCLELRDLCKSYHMLPFHDLFLLHCAIFAAEDTQLQLVAERVADAAGDKGEKPLDDGEIYAAAWCGMMKHWILGDDAKAAAQAALIWGAKRRHGVFAAAKPLVTPWLKRDWAAFAKAQRSDFDKLWQRIRKDGWTVKSETPAEVVVTTDRYQIQHQWCWAHCGMALLAHRQGANVVCDPFWFPSSAIEERESPPLNKERPGANQMDMF